MAFDKTLHQTVKFYLRFVGNKPISETAVHLINKSLREKLLLVEILVSKKTENDLCQASRSVEIMSKLINGEFLQDLTV